MKNSRTRILVASLVAICFSYANAQEELEKKSVTQINKFQVGVNFSADNCNRILKNTTGDNVNDILINAYNLNDKSKIGFTAGLNFCYNFTKSIAIESGIYYSNKGYQSIIETKDYIKFVSNPSEMRFIYNYNYFDVPIKVNFTFGKKKLRFTTSAGIVLNRFLNANEITYIEYYDAKANYKTKEVSDKIFHTLNISTTLSAGIDWKLSSKSNLKIEPTFRYGLREINIDPIATYLWNLGMNVNYLFGF